MFAFCNRDESEIRLRCRFRDKSVLTLFRNLMTGQEWDDGYIQKIKF